MINIGQILGRVGKIETKPIGTGSKVTNMSMVTSKKYMKDGQSQEKITWHNVTLFNQVAEIAEKYVGVGDLLFVQGEMDNKKFTGQDGIERTRSFLLGHKIELLPQSKKMHSDNKPPVSNQDKIKQEFDPFLDDSVPF